MSMTLNEIYESFIWNSSYTEEEYEKKISAGINEGKEFKYLYPFIQPIVPELGKCLWEPCARIVVSKSDEELAPYLFLLFEWFQDMNWPGAYTIFDRLLKMPFSMLEKDYTYCKERATSENDALWLRALDDFEKAYKK